MFNWGHTVGGYDGYDTQSSYGYFKCGFNEEIAKIATSSKMVEYEKCLSYQQKPLHQFTPFPYNLLEAIKDLLPHN